MQVTINGTSQTLGPQSIGEIMTSMGLNPTYVVVEINQKIMKGPDAQHLSIADGDQIEFIQFVGGGQKL
jgi:thiamine biosynthesis protein ThiS